MKAVLDTNVIISALLGQGSTRRIQALWSSKAFIPIASADIVGEYLKVLSYPAFKENPDEAAKLLNDALLDFIEMAHPKNVKLPYPSRDPSDDIFLAAALTSNAHALVTGDKDLLVLSGKYAFPILKPTDFMSRFFKP